MEDSNGKSLNLISLDSATQQAREEIDILKSDLANVMHERDHLLYVECENIMARYQIAFGALEYKVFELECEIRRQQRKAQLIRAKMNHQERVIITEIEEKLDQEFVEYQERLSEKMRDMSDALDRYQGGKLLTDEEEAQLKKLYRGIIKELHPDINPNCTQQQITLFHNAVEAYKSGDLERMNMICVLISDPLQPQSDTDLVFHYESEKARLQRMLERVEENIAQIKTRFPYNKKALLLNAEKVVAYKDELREKVDELKKVLDAWRHEIEELIGATV